MCLHNHVSFVWKKIPLLEYVLLHFTFTQVLTHCIVYMHRICVGAEFVCHTTRNNVIEVHGLTFWHLGVVFTRCLHNFQLIGFSLLLGDSKFFIRPSKDWCGFAGAICVARSAWNRLLPYAFCFVWRLSLECHSFEKLFWKHLFEKLILKTDFEKNGF